MLKFLSQCHPRYPAFTCQLKKTWNKHPLGQCSLCDNNCCTMLHIFSCCQYSVRTGRYNWRHDMVLCEIVYQLVPAIIKARCPTVDDGDKQNVTGIAFRTDSGNKYNKIAWLGTGKQEIIRDCEDWLVIWYEDKCPAYRNNDNTKKTRHHFLLTIWEARYHYWMHCTCWGEPCTGQLQEKSEVWRFYPGRTKYRRGAEVFPCRGQIKRIHK